MRQNLTEAQYIVCRAQLRSQACPVCCAPKDSQQCLCKRCYFSLPLALRAPLWIERHDRESLTQWAERYSVAKDYLRRQDPELDEFEVMT